MRTGDLCLLAAELASEHGADAVNYARRAVITLEGEGEDERAQFWFALSILLDDIVTQRVDPDRPVVIH
ncbi:MAG TPA: hypothetical protein VLC29_06505 [Rhizomicrobium sp.]|jgi:hypothetical protein|nr:hypothetical protein [Rhizomicrobium sp.]